MCNLYFFLIRNAYAHDTHRRTSTHGYAHTSASVHTHIRTHTYTHTLAYDTNLF